MSKLINDVNKFSWAQMTSNNDGKTSASGTMGVVIVMVGALCFLLGCVDKMWINKDIDIVTQSIIFVGIGASLLGWRKHKSIDLTQTKLNNELPTGPLNS